MSQPAGRVIVYGGSGSLGTKCVSKFKSNNWWVASVAFTANTEADSNILVLRTDSFEQQERKVLDAVKAALGQNKVDAIVNAAGGWASGNATEQLVQKSDSMWQKNVCTSIIAATLAAGYLKTGGLLAFIGNSFVLKPTPNLMAYSLSKAAVDNLAISLSAKDSGLPSGSYCAVILPETLDYPAMREGNPTADFTSWTSLDFCADLFLKWANNKERPVKSVLVQLVTKNSVTEVIPL